MSVRRAACLVFGGWILLTGASLGIAHAQEVPVPKIIIVDTNRILRESSAAQGIVQQIEAMNKALQEDIGREEQKLNQERIDLEKQRAILTPEVFQAKMNEFEVRRRSIQDTIQKRGQSIGASLNDANGKLQIALQPILTSIIADKGANLLLEKSRVAFHVPEMDVTEEALIQLNAQTPSIAIQPLQTAQ